MTKFAIRIDFEQTSTPLMQISKDITIEDLVEQYPFSVRFMAEHGIRCIACGEPIWGTLEEACKEKDMSDEKIDQIIVELNKMEKTQ